MSSKEIASEGVFMQLFGKTDFGQALSGRIEQAITSKAPQPSQPHKEHIPLVLPDGTVEEPLLGQILPEHSFPVIESLARKIHNFYHLALHQSSS